MAVAVDHNDIQAAVHQLGRTSLSERALVQHIYPLFSQTLQRREIYLANHSLGKRLTISLSLPK